MGRKSKISKLTPDIKAHIERLIASGQYTIDELLDELRRAYPSKAAELPSRAGLGRYSKDIERVLQNVKASTAATKLIQAEAGDNQDARSEGLTALVQTQFFEVLMTLQEASADGVDPADRVKLLGNAARNVAALSRSSVNLKKFQGEVEEATRKKLLAEQAAKLSAMSSKGGVTQETQKTIREFLGLE